MHLRALALVAADLKPAKSQPLEFIVEDAKGNKVFRQQARTSDFGVASVDFTLATEVNNGNYKLTVTLGDTSSERTVTVKPYVLPKFKVEASADRPFYLPGEKARGKIAANYFFGKPVDGAKITIVGYTFDVARRETLNLTGKTDAAGNFSFDFTLPTYVTAGGLDQRQSSFVLEVTVTDKADHTEQTSLALPVAADRLVIDAVPESGNLKLNVENIIYVITSYPDGSPAACRVTVTLPDGKTVNLTTGKYGLGEVRVVPTSRSAQFRFVAQDERGNTAQVTRNLSLSYNPEEVLLRVDRATAQVGETLHVDAFTSAPAGDIFLDIIRNRQTVSTRVLPMQSGKASADIDLTPDLFGTIELHAYKVLSSGSIVRDTRLVVVSSPRDLTVKMTADKETYLPGGQSQVNIQVTDKDGKPTQAVLGISAVDESVFALSEMDPGFAKLYFLLEKELMQPKYEIHGFTLPDILLKPTDDVAIRTAQQTTARAALARAPASQPFGLNILSYATKQQDLMAWKRAAFLQVANATGVALVLIPLVILALSLIQLKRERVLLKSMGLTLLAGVALLFLLALLVLTLQAILNDSTQRPFLPVAIGGVYFVFLALGFLALAILALRYRDGGLGFTVFASLSYLALWGVLIYAIVQANALPGMVLAGLVTCLLLPLALLLRAAGFGVTRRWPALAITLVMAFLLLLPALLLAAGLQELGSTIAPVNALDGELQREGPVLRAGPLMSLSAPVPTQVAGGEKGTPPAAAPGQEPPRLRQYFPETLFWKPDLLTDDKGQAQVTIPMADSITTWRLSALASSQKGELGTAQTGLRVFQDFFVDLDLPVSLTQNDEVSVPVAVYNYLPQPQKVRLALKAEPWFTMLDGGERELTINANDIQAVYFRIRVVHFGEQKLTVTATGERMSDAIARAIRVIPDGKLIEVTVSDRLQGQASQRVTIPEPAIAGASKVIVKVYPGILSQVVEGLDAILRMPYGCFEQTSSTTYPNVLVLAYMKQVGKATPEIRLKAEQYIGLGYQRLTTFEVSGGGFSLFGQAPADTVLSAYGVMEFNDMSKVWSVDKALIDRTARWIIGQQQPDGSWTSQMGLTHNATWDKLKNSRLPVTAYITWALAEAGYKNEAGRGLNYLRAHLDEADDSYVLALVANAFAASDPKDPATKQAVDRLEAMKQQDGDSVYWQSKIETMMGGVGKIGSVENTALATYALLRADAYPDTVNKALTYLIKSKDPRGTWYTTQATVLALKSLLLSVSKGEKSEGTVKISLNGKAAAPITLKPETSDLVQMIVFGPEGLLGGENRLELALAGKGNVMYQITSEYYLPWPLVPPLPEAQELIDIAVKYDRTTLTVNDIVTASVSIRLTRPGTANWVLVDLGLPPGFEVLVEDLNALVEPATGGATSKSLPGPAPTIVPAPRPGVTPTPIPGLLPTKPIKRYDLTGRQIIVYLETLTYNQPVQFTYRLRARYPIKAQTLASTAYDYYNPDRIKVAAPVLITVLGE